MVRHSSGLLCDVYTTRMAVKTVSLKTEAYDRLRAARCYPGESFSEVVLRASWPEDTLTGADLLRRYREHGPHFTEAELAAMESVKASDLPPEDKWKTH